MADYSAIKSSPEKNDLHCFTFFPNSEKPTNAVIRHIPPATPAEDISNSPDEVGVNAINVRQMAANRSAPKGQTHVETTPIFLVN
jgi:hypothetical protein